MVRSSTSTTRNLVQRDSSRGEINPVDDAVRYLQKKSPRLVADQVGTPIIKEIHLGKFAKVYGGIGSSVFW
jgi:hypothetical protein